MSTYVVSALYKFVTLEDYEVLRAPLLKIMEDNMVRGTLLLAKEGINGTIAGTESSIGAVLKFLKSTNMEIGYLINFGENNLTWKRYINT